MMVFSPFFFEMYVLVSVIIICYLYNCVFSNLSTGGISGMFNFFCTCIAVDRLKRKFDMQLACCIAVSCFWFILYITGIIGELYG